MLIERSWSYRIQYLVVCFQRLLVGHCEIQKPDGLWSDPVELFLCKATNAGEEKEEEASKLFVLFLLKFFVLALCCLLMPFGSMFIDNKNLPGSWTDSALVMFIISILSVMYEHSVTSICPHSRYTYSTSVLQASHILVKCVLCQLKVVCYSRVSSWLEKKSL